MHKSHVTEELERLDEILPSRENLKSVKAIDNQTIMTECKAILHNDIPTSEAIDRLLRLVGSYYKADRAYVFEFTDGSVNNTYEWCAEGVTAEIDNLQGLPMELAESWLNGFRQHGEIYISELTKDIGGDLYELLAAQGISSLIAVPIISAGIITGFIGVDNPKEKIDNHDAINFVSLFICSSILRRNHERLLMMENLSQKEKLGRANSFVNYFVKSYVSAHYLNLDDLSMTAYNGGEDQGKAEPVTTDYLKHARSYIDECVHPDDREKVYEAMRPEHIRKTLREDGEFSTTFRDTSSGEEKLYRFQIIRGEDESHAALCLMDVTNAVRAEREQKERIDQYNKIINSLATDYSSVYVVNLATSKFAIYKMSDRMIGLFGDTFKKADYETACEAYVDSSVIESQKEEMREALSVPFLREHLRGVSSYTKHYMNNEGKYAEMRVTTVAGSPDEVVMGFGVKDAEIRKEKEEELWRRNSLEEEKANLSSMLDSMSEDFECLLHADFDTNVETHYRISEKFSQAIADWADDSNYLKRLRRFGETLVVPEDREKFFAETKPDTVMKKLRDGESYCINYRINLDGQELWFETKFVRHKTHACHNCAIIRIHNVDSTIREYNRQIRMQAEQQAVIMGLSEDFASVTYIDPTTKKDKVFRFDKKYAPLLPRWNEINNFEERLQYLSDTLVHPDDRESFQSLTGEGVIMDELAKAPAYYVKYREIIDGKVEYWQAKFVLTDTEPLQIVCGFMSVDKATRIQLESKETLERNLEIIDILASEYSSVYYVNLKTEELIPYMMNKETEEEFGESFRSGIRYSDALRMYVDKVVYGKDKDLMLRAGSIRSIKSQLAKRKSFAMTYRMDYNGEPAYCEMKFVKVNDENDPPTAIALGFSNKDEETIRRYVDSKLHDNYIALYHADLEREKMHVIVNSPQNSVGKRSKVTDYREEMSGFTGSLLDEYKDDWTKFSQPEYMRGYLAKEDKLDYMYRIKTDGSRWRRASFQVIERNEDGVPLAILISFIYLDANTIENLNLQKRISEQNKKLEEQQQELERALTMAQSANKAKTTFLNSMSHDIRTPMNAIIGYTNLATSHIDNKEQVLDYLSKIGQSSDHLLSLINDVLDMRRIESGNMTLNEMPESLAEIVHTLSNIVQADIHAKNLEFFVDSEDIMDERVLCDKLRLNQILLNVLSNAIKYTQSGGKVSLHVCQKPSSRPGYGSYEFKVKDNGMGISKEFLKTIFDPFTRVNSSTVSGIQGTGLGMAITKSIIDMCGGTIEIESEEGYGTEAIINLDFKLERAHVDPEPIQSVKGMRGLVIDNDLSMCRNISKMLQEAGMKADWCSSGKEAVFRVEEALYIDNPYSICVIEWMMPDQTGMETAKRIRRIMGEKAKIIILTSYDYTEIEEEAKEAGVCGFISKPVFPSDLRRALNQFCGGDYCGGEVKKEYDFSGKRILLVDDNEMNREIAQEILQENGLLVDTAEDGTVAVDIINKSMPGYYDAVLMDIQMPIMDGYEATRRIRALEDRDLAGITIIAMTANAFEEDRRMSLEAGLDEHIAKPINIPKLKETLRKYLEAKDSKNMAKAKERN